MTDAQRQQIEAICDAVLGPSSGRILYHMDEDGWLWSGPHKTDDKLRYARFCGFMTAEPFNPIWALEKQDVDHEWMWQTDEMAMIYMNKIKTGVWKLPTYEKED